ncbi:MAG TPA: hypothetical protein VJA25_13950, partial [Dehalococcoidia bacterium]|nr:hypothetical protein [Dehalococcoidia bacterium]
CPYKTAHLLTCDRQLQARLAYSHPGHRHSGFYVVTPGELNDIPVDAVARLGTVRVAPGYLVQPVGDAVPHQHKRAAGTHGWLTGRLALVGLKAVGLTTLSNGGDLSNVRSPGSDSELDCHDVLHIPAFADLVPRP